MNTALAVLLSVALGALAGGLLFRADRARAVPRPWITALLRGITVALTALLLLSPLLSRTLTTEQKPLVVFLQDDSRSVPEALEEDTAAFRKSAEDFLDRLDGRARTVRWSFGAGVRTDSPFRYRDEATAISAALQRVQDFYGGQPVAAVVLATDGRYTEGLNPLYQSLSLAAPLYTVPLGDSAPPTDQRIAGVYHNRTVQRGQPFEVRADVVATGCAGFSGAATLQEVGGNTVGTAALDIPTDRYDRGISFAVPTDRPGLRHYVLSLPRAEGEKNVSNNRRDIFVEVVEEKRTILLAAAAPHPDVAALREALQGLESYTVTTRTDGLLPASLAPFSAVILHGLPGAQGVPGPRKPVWYIAAPGMTPPAFNAAQQAINLAGNPGTPRDAQGTLAANFSLFAPPPGTGAVVDRMPPLAVPSGGWTASPAAATLVAGRDGGGPLWTLLPGRPPTAVTMGTGLWRWRLYEYRLFGQHRVVDEAIRQTVAFLAAGGSDQAFRVDQPKTVWTDREAVTFTGYLLNAAGEAVNESQATLSITDSAGRRREFRMERTGSAYRLSAGVWGGGTYRWSASVVYGGRTLTAAGQFAVQSQPIELVETGADYPLLAATARKYGGALVPWQALPALADSLQKGDALKPRLVMRTDTAPLVDWRPFFFLVLLCAGAEWAVRKWWLV